MGATQGQLTRDGVEVHWWLTANDPDAPLLVCTHGGAMDHRMWDSQVDGLAHDYRILSHDLRGHGQSKCPGSKFSVDAACDDLVALIDTVGAEVRCWSGIR